MYALSNMLCLLFASDVTVWLEDTCNIMFRLHANSFPLWGCVENFINCFFGQGVVHVLNEVLSNFRQNPQVSVYFQSLVNLIGRVIYCYSNGLGCLVPCESLDGFQKIGIH